MRTFRQQWADIGSLQLTETLAAEADAGKPKVCTAWEFGLRGYDAVHLASARIWQETISEPVTLATFDKHLWEAAQKAGTEVWPDSL